MLKAILIINWFYGSIFIIIKISKSISNNNNNNRSIYKYQNSDYNTDSNKEQNKTKTNTPITPPQQKKSTKSIIAEAKGTYGEHKLYQTLQDLPGHKKFISNCYLEKTNAETTEIDIIMIHRTGIYVFESKNYSGWIYGSEDDDVWVQLINTGKSEQAYTFYNPVLQNKGHIKWLKTYLSKFKGLNYFSIIVFGNKCELAGFDIKCTNTIVTKIDKAYDTIQKTIDNEPLCLTEESVDYICNILKPFTEINELKKRKHVNSLKGYHF